MKTISIDTEDQGQLRVKLQIWDTGGQERFSSIRPMYYRGSLGALLIFDLTSYESFEHLPQWIEEVRSNIKSDVPFLLVGNKSDLLDQRAVSIEEINSFTDKFNLYYMETSAKTGEGVGDCFYILACLMVGSGVPNQLVSSGTVFSPGKILTTPSKPTIEITPEIEPKVDIPALIASETSPIFEPEPEIEFAAPPIPESKSFKEPEPSPIFEPEPEIEFAAPPVPEPTQTKIFKSEMKIESEIDIPEPEIEVPGVQPKEFEFKTPDDIISQETLTEMPKVSESSETPVYKPKTIPFSSNIPIPAPPPEEFQKETRSDSLFTYMPEPIIPKKEQKKLEKERKKEEKGKAKLEKERKFREEKEEKERAKLEKERKIQEEKEKARLEKARKIQEKKEKAAKLKAEMQAVGKEQKIKPKKEKKQISEDFEIITEIPFQAKVPESTESKQPSSLFHTLSQKTKESTQTQDDSFVPFISSEKSQALESSNLRIIPNVADITNEKYKAPLTPSEPIPPISSEFPVSRQTKTPRRKEVIICSQCGAMLSTDYAFCNKCGGKLV